MYTSLKNCKKAEQAYYANKEDNNGKSVSDLDTKRKKI
jgi:hypothetical protein